MDLDAQFQPSSVLSEAAKHILATNYDEHPTDLDNVHVPSGTTPASKDINGLRAAIPAHCFKPLYTLSFAYLARDVSLACALGWAAVQHIPLLPHPLSRALAWGLYGVVQGMVFTGLWIIGHDCGHDSFSPSKPLNAVVGFILHSFLLTPYFAWRSTHRRHHIYANHMDLDHNYVPPRKDEYISSFQRLRDEAAEDAPLYILIRVTIQQVFGFPLYLLTNLTASSKSMHGEPSNVFLGNSHFAPWGPLFRPEEAMWMVLSDIGVLATMAGLTEAGRLRGSLDVVLLYVVPYMMVNHWIVAITYLHHTHPDLPKFEAPAWTFIRGATATVDRELWFVGRHFFHNIIEFHVIHHLFSRIPHYHIEEATRAIRPLLGDMYHEEKKQPFFVGLWQSFTQCQWVGPQVDDKQKSKGDALWYRGGRMPPVECAMGYKGWGKKFR